MKQFKPLFSLLLSLVSLFGLTLALSSCDDMSKEPTPTSEKLEFPAEGGSQTVEIRSMDGSKLRYRWRFMELTTPNKHGEYVRNEEVEFESDILPDGSMQIKGEWVTYTISKDNKQVQIDVAPNPTDQPRFISFDAHGNKSGFSIRCFQKAGTPPAEQQ